MVAIPFQSKPSARLWVARLRVALMGVVVLWANTFELSTASAQYPNSTYLPPTVSTRQWSVTSPFEPDPVATDNRQDHQAMSPDSWSAPRTPVRIPGASLPGAFAPNASGANAFAPNDFDPNAFTPGPSSGPDKQPTAGTQPLSTPSGLSFGNAPQIPQLGAPDSPRTMAPNQQDSPFQPSGFRRNDDSKTNIRTSPDLDRKRTSGPANPSNRYSLAGDRGNEKLESALIRQSPLGLASPTLQTPGAPAVVASPRETTQRSVQRWQPSLAPAKGSLYDLPRQEPTITSGPIQQPTLAPQAMESPFGLPNYRPDLGHRTPTPLVRNPGSWDSGEEFDFENKKKEYPPLGEIFATGRYFGSASVLYLQPSFQANTAITTQAAASGQSIPFDFDYESAPELRLGFESKYGPGVELKYWQYDETSNTALFTSSAAVSGEASTWMMGPSRWTRLATSAAGQQLVAEHTLDVETFTAMVFKEIKFPISRLNGSFGFQYVSIAQTMDAELRSGAAVIGRLNSSSDMRAYGPRFLFEYYRPVGHTKLEFVTSFAGSAMFGERDQFVSNTATGEFSRVGADEFITTTEFSSGIQFKKMIAENRGVYGRIGYLYQVWHGGGTAVDAQDDFGLRGFSFAFGFNR